MDYDLPSEPPYCLIFPVACSTNASAPEPADKNRRSARLSGSETASGSSAPAPTQPSSSSASAGSGENRLDRRGESDPVLLMLEDVPEEESGPVSRSVNETMPSEDCFRRDGEVRGLEGEDFLGGDRAGYDWGSSSSRMPSKDSC